MERIARRLQLIALVSIMILTASLAQAAELPTLPSWLQMPALLL